MSERKPTLSIAERSNKICPICKKRSYSRDGVHPQCAMIRSDEIFNKRLDTEMQTKTSKETN